MYGSGENFIDSVCNNCLRIDKLEKEVEKLLLKTSAEKAEEGKKLVEKQLEVCEKKAYQKIEEKFAELLVSKSSAANNNGTRETNVSIQEEEWTKKEIKAIKEKVNKVENKIKNTDQHELRRNNIIIHRMAESAADKEDQKRTEDRKSVLSLFKVLEVSCESLDIKKVIRLGRESEKDRPLLVELKEATKKNLILESLFKLKNAEEKFRRVSVTHDMTRIEKEQCKKLVIEANEKQNND